jgi:hypothetical protein
LLDVVDAANAREIWTRDEQCIIKEIRLRMNVAQKKQGN